VATVQALKVQADNCCVLLADRLAFSRLALIPEAVFFSNEAHEGTKISRKDAKTQRKEGDCDAFRRLNVSRRNFSPGKASVSGRLKSLLETQEVDVVASDAFGQFKQVREPGQIVNKQHFYY
jgi:hypothetical protein